MDTIFQQDQKYLGRDVPATDIEIVGGEGSYLIDSTGKRYVDFLMGWCVGNLGWGIKEIRDRISNFDGPDYVNPYYLYQPWVELAEKLVKITPGKLSKSFRATGGTEAVEIALQAAMAYTNRQKFISVAEGYHGHSLAALSLGISSFKEKYGDCLFDCMKVKSPFNKEKALEIREKLSHKDIAAYISEPIICNLGVEIPDKDYYQIIQESCREFGTVFIVDEVATGFGRTGKMFASEYYDIEPDIMCLGKGITGGYGVLATAIMTEEIASAMKFDFSFYSTFGWHPRNVEAALANIDYWEKHGTEILQNVEKMSWYFKERLTNIKFMYKTIVRIKGLAIGLEFDKNGYAKELVERCRSKGLLFGEFDVNMATIFPALTINQETAKKGLDILESCV